MAPDLVDLLTAGVPCSGRADDEEWEAEQLRRWRTAGCAKAGGVGGWEVPEAS